MHFPKFVNLLFFTYHRVVAPMRRQQRKKRPRISTQSSHQVNQFLFSLKNQPNVRPYLPIKRSSVSSNPLPVPVAVTNRTTIPSILSLT